MRHGVKAFLIAAVTLMCVPAQARADGYITPFFGINFNNPSGDGRANYGVDFGWMSRGIAGLEGDVGYSPNFFGSPGGYGDNHVLTAMGNLIVGVPIGSTHTPAVRPYFTIGAGVVQTRVDGTTGPNGVQKIDTNNVGMNVGGGVMGYFSHHVGLRGDVRYIINFNDNSNTVQFGQFHFWRGSVGIVLRP